MDESKFDELKNIHHDLAEYLEQQNEVIIALRRAVGAVQHTLDSDSAPRGVRSALSERYKEYLAAQAPTEPLRPNPMEVLSREAVNSLVKKLKDW